MELFDWKKIIADFKAKALQFKNALDFLVNNPGKFTSPALKAERESLIKSGNIIKATVETTTAAIDKANQLLNSFKDFIGLSANDKSLGALPVVLPMAIVAASISALTYWLTNFNSLQRKMYDDLIKQGVPAKEATKIVSAPNVSANPVFNPLASDGGGFLEMLKKVAPFAIVLGGLVLAFK